MIDTGLNPMFHISFMTTSPVTMIRVGFHCYILHEYYLLL